MDKEQMHYHYAECGLDNIYLVNGFKFMETPRGQSISIHDMDGLHRAIGLHLLSKKDLSKKEIRFLRDEMLRDQSREHEEISNLENEINDPPILFVDTKQGWLSVA